MKCSWSQIFVSFLFIGVYLLVADVVLYFAWQIHIAAFIAWLVFFLAIAGWTIKRSIKPLKQNIKYVATYMGDAYDLYEEHTDANPGLGGFVIAFPPFFGLAELHKYPVFAFELPFESSATNTGPSTAGGEDSVPVNVFARATMQLPHTIEGMKKLLQFFPILTEEQDLTCLVPMDFFAGITKEGVLVTPEIRKVPLIAKIIRDLIDPAFDEAIGRAIPDFTLTDARTNRVGIENRIRDHLGGISGPTIAQLSGILVYKAPPEKTETELPLFDLNVAGVIPIDPSLTVALSVETTKRLLAKGRHQEGIGERKYLEEVNAGVPKTRHGLAVLAATTMKETKNTVVVAPDLFSAGMGGFLANQRQQPALPPAPPAPGGAGGPI